MSLSLRQFTPGKFYALDGATLQALFDAVGTNRLLPSDEYSLEISPGKGTRLRMSQTDESCRFGVRYNSIDGEATINPGRVYGGGGGVGDFSAPETIAIPSLPRYIYAKVTIEVIATVAYWDSGPEYIGNAAVTDIEIVQSADGDLNWEAPDPVVGDTGFAHLLLAEIDAEGIVEQVTCGDVTMIYCPPFSLSFHPRP